jgi:hypothetical protein
MSVRILAIACLLGCGIFAQDAVLFSSDLRAKYGPPRSRETFQPKPGVEMVVDYAANGHVCRIHLPPIAPSKDPTVITPQAIDDFVNELVPPAMRGKEIGRMMEALGRASVKITQFERVSISESYDGDGRTGVAIAFTKEKCLDSPGE